MKKLLFIMLVSLFALTINAQTLLDTALNFIVKDTYGNTLELYEILDEGKMVAIDFFSTTWGTCQFYAPDLQAAYEEFGCNDGNVFFMGIDKGNTNANVMEFDSLFGVHYPGISGQDGGGNAVHFLYEIQATPTFLVINPDRSIAVYQVWPPTFENLVDSISNVGGISQPCMTNIAVNHLEDILSIGPNPVKDYAYLHLDLVKEKEIEIHIFNLTGKKVLAINPAYYPAGKNIVKADISREPEGFYFVQVVEKGEVIATKKLILVK